jgi:hypothetical protein
MRLVFLEASLTEEIMTNPSCKDDKGVYNGSAFLELTSAGKPNSIWFPKKAQLLPLLVGLAEVQKCKFALNGASRRPSSLRDRFVFRFVTFTVILICVSIF